MRQSISMIETSCRSTSEFEFLRSGKISVVDVSASNYHQNLERKGRRPKTSNAKKLSLQQVQVLYEEKEKEETTQQSEAEKLSTLLNFNLSEKKSRRKVQDQQ